MAEVVKQLIDRNKMGRSTSLLLMLSATLLAGASTSLILGPMDDGPDDPADEGHAYPNATFSQASSSINREGKPQEWAAAPDSDLPSDYASGDEIIIVWNAEPQTLTPFISRDAYATRIYREVLEQLVWTDTDSLKTVPGLAKSWDVSEDGLTITFHLFKDATFSDGVPVTSEDVVFSYDLIMNPEIDSPVLRSYLSDNVASCKALDEYTVQYKLKQVYFDSVGITGGNWVLPKHIYGDFAPDVFNEKIREKCVGSGPWVLDKWVKGDRIILTRNENYWGPKPAMNRQIFRIIKSDQAEWQEFKAGNADLVGPTSEQWTRQKDDDWMKENSVSFDYYSPLGGYAYIGYNLRLPKFEDRRVRQAFTMLIDREELIDTLREGLGQIVTGPFFFESDQYNQEIEPWPYDPDLAKEYLSEVGWEDTDGDGVLDKDLDGDGIRDPFEITFLMPSGGTYGERLQRYVQSKFQSAGIKVILDQLEWSVFEQRLTERNFEMVSLAWTGSAESDPYQIWHSSQAENRGSNYIGYKNDEVDDLIMKARVTMDRTKRMEMWHRMQEILHEDQPYTFLFNRPSLVFLDNRFENVKRHPLRLFLTEWYVAEPEQLR